VLVVQKCFALRPVLEDVDRDARSVRAEIWQHAPFVRLAHAVEDVVAVGAHAVGGDLPRAWEAAGVVPRRAGERGGRALEPSTRSR